MTFTVNGINCQSASTKFIATFGYGLLQSFVSQGYAPSVASADATICGKNVQEAYASTQGFSRRLQSSTAVAFTATGSAAQLSKISDATTSGSGQAAAVAKLNQAVTSALTDAVSYAQANGAGDDLKTAVPSVNSLGATPLTTATVAQAVVSVTQPPVILPGQPGFSTAGPTTAPPILASPTPSSSMSSAYIGFSAVLAAVLALFLA